MCLLRYIFYTIEILFRHKYYEEYISVVVLMIYSMYEYNVVNRFIFLRVAAPLA